MRIHWLWLSSMPKLSQQLKRKLLEYFGSPEEVYNADERMLKKCGILTADQMIGLLNKDMTAVSRLASYCERRGIGYITIQDSYYPPRLRALSDAPIVLYYKGRLPDFEQHPMIGVVGTRNASLTGLRAAQKLGGEIALCGGIVVSGGAAGIDICALRGAFAAGMPTVTVLAGGLDKLYPKENEAFFAQLCETGCLLSESAPGEAVFKGSFLQRNRLISGMCNGILVVEAPERSGALNTAHWAKEQGKDLFAVPGAPGTPECEGSNALLEDGAYPAVSGWAVMRIYADRYKYAVAERSSPTASVPDIPIPKPKIDKKDIDKSPTPAYSVIEKQLPPLNEREQILTDRLKQGPVLSEQLAAETGMNTAEFMRLITMLTMKGVIDTDHGGRVYLK